jgi:hypothetical protein
VSVVISADGKTGHVRSVVALVGDSNLLLSSYLFNSELVNRRNGYVLVSAMRSGAGIRTKDCMQAAGCMTYDFWKTRLRELHADVHPDVYVVNLGINDTASAGDAGSTGYVSYAQKINWFMSLVPSGSKVLWTNLPCDIMPTTRRTGCAEVNFALAVAPARWPNLEVLRWAAIENKHPEYAAAGDIHYTASGYWNYVQFVEAALDART